jgi:hypothetical protein
MVGNIKFGVKSAFLNKIIDTFATYRIFFLQYN